MQFYVRVDSSRFSASSSGFTPCMHGFLTQDWLSLSIYIPIMQDPVKSSSFHLPDLNRLISTIPFQEKKVQWKLWHIGIVQMYYKGGVWHIIGHI